MTASPASCLLMHLVSLSRSRPIYGVNPASLQVGCEGGISRSAENDVLHIPIRTFHRKRIRQMPDLVDAAVLKQDLDNIEPDLNIGIVEQAQVIQGCTRQTLTPLFIHSGSRPDPF